MGYCCFEDFLDYFVVVRVKAFNQSGEYLHSFGVMLLHPFKNSKDVGVGHGVGDDGIRIMNGVGVEFVDGDGCRRYNFTQARRWR